MRALFIVGCIIFCGSIAGPWVVERVVETIRVDVHGQPLAPANSNDRRCVVCGERTSSVELPYCEHCRRR